MANKISDIKKYIPRLLKDPYNYAQKVSISHLVEILQKLSYYYYNTDESLVPDEIYDMLREVLKERDPDNPYLKEVGAPISKDKVKLPHYMPSLDKIKPDTDALEVWKKTYKGPYVLSDKLDGVSGLLIKRKNGFKLYTRGDGIKGQNISFLVPYVVPKKVDINDIPINTAIRGELVISKRNWEKIEDKFKTIRNAVGGLVNSKDYSVEVAKITDFVAFSVVHPRHNQEEQMLMLKEWGFDIVVWKTCKTLTNDMLSKYLKTRREKGKYEIDGIVVVDGSKSYPPPKKLPLHAFAFKAILTDQIAEATVLDVEWNCSKHGYLKPTVLISPVVIKRVKIERATAFNARFVVENLLGPGAVIKLIRSGDVIPHIMEVLKPAASGRPKSPDVNYRWNKTCTDIIVEEGECEDIITVKQITSFFSKLEVKYISDKFVGKLVENGYTTIFEVLEADADDLIEIDGIGIRLVTKIYTNIDNAIKNANLQTIMAASGIFRRGLGVRKLKLVVEAYPNILKYTGGKAKLEEMLINVEGFGEVMAPQFAENFNDFKKFYKRLSKMYGISVKPTLKSKPQTKSKPETFEDKKIVFSGFRDKKMEAYIEDNGGKVTSSVSKNTNLVVYYQAEGKPLTAKLKKAKELDIEIMTRDLFSDRYM